MKSDSRVLTSKKRQTYLNQGLQKPSQPLSICLLLVWNQACNLEGAQKPCLCRQSVGTMLWQRIMTARLPISRGFNALTSPLDLPTWLCFSWQIGRNDRNPKCMICMIKVVLAICRFGSFYWYSASSIVVNVAFSHCETPQWRFCKHGSWVQLTLASLSRMMLKRGWNSEGNKKIKK